MKTKIIAEIASSHNGDIELAKAMIKAAADAGVDYVKFQSWQAKNVRDDDPDKNRYRKLELSDEAHRLLIGECDKNGIGFLTSVFDRNRIPFLKSLGINIIKIPSVYCQSEEMLLACRDNFETIILSTGLSYEGEVSRAAEILKGHDFALLHCVASYPLPKERANLARMRWLQSIAPRWGLSDHCYGAEAAKVAVAMGADFVEKHFTLSRYLPQETHKTSDEAEAKAITTHMIADEPDVFREICQWRDLVSKMIGSGQKEMMAEEKSVRKKYTGRLGT